MLRIKVLDRMCFPDGEILGVEGDRHSTVVAFDFDDPPKGTKALKTEIGNVIDKIYLTPSPDEENVWLWSVGAQTIPRRGRIACQLEVADGEDVLWQSTIFTLRVEKTIDSNTPIEEAYPSILIQWEARMEELEEEISQTIELSGGIYTPAVTEAGVLSWTNNKELPNPPPVNIKGPQGIQGSPGSPGADGAPFTYDMFTEAQLAALTGPQGPQGPQGVPGSDGQDGSPGSDGSDGAPGAVFTPSVSAAGVISWTNNGGLVNPTSVNIKGPQGNPGQDGRDGSPGAVFTPSVSTEGLISWTNNGGLPNPSSVNIKGPQGVPGQDGSDGATGSPGAVFTPSVSTAGLISWTNNGGLVNPTSVNIMGPQGPQGSPGSPGADGQDGSNFTILGYYATLSALQAAATNPAAGDAYGVGSGAPYTIYVYDGVNSVWVDNGTIQGPAGPAGAVFTPAVSAAGVISWTNNGGLVNPSDVNIKGPKGDTGSPGADGSPGSPGSPGAVFTPAVSSAGVISWTNNGGLVNPTSVNIKGPQGDPGSDGQDGAAGPAGAVFTPSVSTAGDISWTNNGGLTNPTTRNIKGPAGPAGSDGADGSDGYTPVRGTDYWTSADQTAIINQVASASDAKYLTAVSGSMSAGGVGTAFAIKQTKNGTQTTVGQIPFAEKVDNVWYAGIPNGPMLKKLDEIEAGAQVNTVASVAGKTGAVTLAKGDVGLGNVDNTSDENKPVSTATQTALNGKANASDLTSHTGNTTVHITSEERTAWNGKADLSDGKISPTQASAATVDISANTTVGTTHEGKQLYCTNTSAITITLGTGCAVGTEIEFIQDNTGTVTFAAASGCSIRSKDNKLTIGGRYGAAGVKYKADNVWYLWGDLS